MDIKQLVTGNPKTGFYPVTQDTITVIELNKSVMSLTNKSSSEDIIAAFDNLESFQALIAEVRNPQNICSGILINDTETDLQVGKYEASIIARTDTETLNVRWVENDKIVALSITNTDGTMSCIRNENNVGGGSENIYIIDGNKINDNTFNIDDFNKLKTAIRNNNIVFINITEDPSYVNIIGTQILSYGETLIQLYVIDYSKADGEKLAEYIIFNIAIESDSIKITKIQSNLENKFLTKEDVLTKNNTTEFTPTEDYNPATKKYVDDKTTYNIDFTELESDILSNNFNSFVNAKYSNLYDDIKNNINKNIRCISNRIIFKVKRYTSSPSAIFIEFDYNEISSGFPTVIYKSGFILYYNGNIEFDEYNFTGRGYPYNINFRWLGEVKNSDADIINEEIYELLSISSSDYTNTIVYLGIVYLNSEYKKVLFTLYNYKLVGYIENMRIVISRKEVENEISIKYEYIQRVLTESEYAALGEAVNTDDVLYFVTPDA